MGNPPAQHQASRKIRSKRIGIELNLEVLEDVWERTFLAQLEAAVAINTSQLNRCSFLLLVSDGTLFVGVIASLSAVAL
jgi:hypothetical protein